MNDLQNRLTKAVKDIEDSYPTRKGIMIEDEAPAGLTEFRAAGSIPVVSIRHDGSIYWNGREVETDEDFKKAMLDIASFFKKETA